MTDIDQDLARRLERLAASVPVRTGELDAVHAGAVQARHELRLRWVTPLIALMTVVGVAALIGPGGMNLVNGPVSATTKLGDFELTIRSTKARYGVGEQVDVSASLTYEGPDGSVTISHGHGSPMGFGIEEAVNGILLSPGWRMSCEPSTLVHGEPLERAFAKSGGSDGSIPGFEAFMKQPGLSLPPGTWHPYVLASFSVGECSANPIEIRAQLKIEVSDDDVIPPSEPPAPSPTPFDGATDLFLLTDPGGPEVCLFRRNTGILVRVGESGLGVRIRDQDRPAVWPDGYSAQIVEGIGALIAPDGRVVAREGDAIVFGGGFADAGPVRPCGGIAVDAASPWIDPSPIAEATAIPMHLATIGPAVDLCPQALGGGTITRNPRTGLGFSHGIGPVTDVLWPAGYTAWIEDGTAVLRNPAGEIVAREGDRVVSGGGFISDGPWYACEFEVVPPTTGP